MVLVISTNFGEKSLSVNFYVKKKVGRQFGDNGVRWKMEILLNSQILKIFKAVKTSKHILIVNTYLISGEPSHYT